MVTRDVLKVLKLHLPTARAILRTFKTSLVPINQEMHSHSYDFLYVYGLPQLVIDRLRYVQNCAARLVTGTRSLEHITPVLRRLH